MIAARSREVLVVLSLAVGLGSATPGSAAVFRVGTGGAPCTHATLAAAVAAAAANGPGNDQVFLTATLTLASPVLIVDQNLEIVGGFVGCADNSPDPINPTTINVQTSDALFVFGGSVLRAVTLQNLQIRRLDGAPLGRLLRIQDASFVTLLGTTLRNGSLDNGGNVWMSGAQTFLILSAWQGRDPAISAGSATGVGGGLYCNGGTISLEAGAIDFNSAAGDGGGVYLDGCDLRVAAGSDRPQDCSQAHPGVRCNASTGGSGGGVFAVNGARVELFGDRLRPAVVGGNQAVRGGGIHLSGSGTTAEARNAWLIDNLASEDAAGIFVRGHATLSWLVDAPGCLRGTDCSRMAGNRASSIGAVGGALAVDTGGDAVVRQTTLTGNRAEETGGVVWAHGDGSTVVMEGCIVHHDLGGFDGALFAAASWAELTVAFSTLDEETGCCRGLFGTTNGGSVRVFSSILLAVEAASGQGRIFDEPAGAAETRVVDCVLYQETTSTLPPPADPGSHQVLASPATTFLDRAAGRYRLRSGSPAIDFCDGSNYFPQTTDIDREARGFDVPADPNLPFGPFDLGADEWRSLLADGFESGGGSAWSGSRGWLPLP